MKDIPDSSPTLISLQIDVKNMTGLKDVTVEIQYSTGSFESIRSDAMALKEKLSSPMLSNSYYCDIDADVDKRPGKRDWIYEGYTLTIQTETTEDDVHSVLNKVILNQ